MNKRYLYCFWGGDWVKYSPEDIELLPDRYISIKGNEPVPFEDLGNCLLSDRDMTVEEAFEEWPG